MRIVYDTFAHAIGDFTNARIDAIEGLIAVGQTVLILAANLRCFDEAYQVSPSSRCITLDSEFQSLKSPITATLEA